MANFRQICRIISFLIILKIHHIHFKMKKLILLLCMISGFAFMHAQTPAFLDVKATESIERQPTSMTYQIRVNPELDEEYDLDRDYAAQRKAMRSRVKENEMQLKQFLESNKIKYTVNREENYNIIRDDMSFSTYNVKVNNRTELDNLVVLLRQLSYVEGNVGEKTYPDTDKDEIGLFEKLFAKAHLKAEKMAALMHCKLGKILEVEDLESQNLSYYEMIQNTDMRPRYEEGQEISSNLVSVVALTMRFRFELIPQ